jgi:hypothetical protein
MKQNNSAVGFSAYIGCLHFGIREAFPNQLLDQSRIKSKYSEIMMTMIPE